MVKSRLAICLVGLCVVYLARFSQCSQYPEYETGRQSRIKLNLGLHVPPIILKMPRIEMPQLIIGANLIKRPYAKPVTINMPPLPQISFGDSGNEYGGSATYQKGGQGGYGDHQPYGSQPRPKTIQVEKSIESVPDNSYGPPAPPQHDMRAYGSAPVPQNFAHPPFPHPPGAFPHPAPYPPQQPFFPPGMPAKSPQEFHAPPVNGPVAHFAPPANFVPNMHENNVPQPQHPVHPPQPQPHRPNRVHNGPINQHNPQAMPTQHNVQFEGPVSNFYPNEQGPNHHHNSQPQQEHHRLPQPQNQHHPRPNQQHEQEVSYMPKPQPRPVTEIAPVLNLPPHQSYHLMQVPVDANSNIIPEEQVNLMSNEAYQMLQMPVNYEQAVQYDELSKAYNAAPRVPMRRNAQQVNNVQH